jgi:hypothetical protein
MRRPRSISIATAALAALAVSAGFAAPTYATPDPTLVDILGCSLFEGGETTVPAGEVEAWLPSWVEKTRGKLKQFLTNQETTLTVQYGSAQATTQDLSDQWSDPYQFDPPPDGLWVSDLGVVSLGTLAPGDTVLVRFELAWTKPEPGGSDDQSCLIAAT